MRYTETERCRRRDRRGQEDNLGTGEEEVKAYVRRKNGEVASPQEIIAWCRDKLSDFKLPRYLEFRDDFPKSAIGRIQKNILKQEKQNLTHGCYDRLADEESIRMNR